MLNKPTYAIFTMVAMGTLWFLGEKWLLMKETIFQNLYFQNFLCFFFSGRALIMKVQSNKKCVSIKTTIKIHFDS